MPRSSVIDDIMVMEGAATNRSQQQHAASFPDFQVEEKERQGYRGAAF